MHKLQHPVTELIFAVFLVCAAQHSQLANAEKVSKFGEYSGHSEARFDSWVRMSQYVEMRDGVKLAVDILRPAVDGKVSDEELPVIMTLTPYGRASWRCEHREEGRCQPGDENHPERRVVTALDSYWGLEKPLVRLSNHGYILVVVQIRGGVASGGIFHGPWNLFEARDGYDVTEWITQQPWSDGNVGMFGLSYLGGTQYMAASTGHPAMKAIVPSVTGFDLYDFIYSGGVYRKTLAASWGYGTRLANTIGPKVRVDEDVDGSLLAQAMVDRHLNMNVHDNWRAMSYRDLSTHQYDWSKAGASVVLDGLAEAQIPAYHFGAWYDLFAYDTPLLHTNYPGPSKMVMGSWTHTDWTQIVDDVRDQIESAEWHRWYDYWLKGIDNGIMDEPAVSYAVMDEPGGTSSWKHSGTWPDPDAEDLVFYFADGASGSLDSENDRSLVQELPEAEVTHSYKIDPSTSTGKLTRWQQTVLVYGDNGDMAKNDAKSLTYTTRPLDEDIVVVGYPIFEIYADISGLDAYFHVLLEEVEPDGTSKYISDGQLSAVMRKTGEAPYDNLGLPWQTGYQADVLPLVPGQVIQLKQEMFPTGYRFKKGNRIRVAVMGADFDQAIFPTDPNAVFNVRAGGESGSRMILPVLP